MRTGLTYDSNANQGAKDDIVFNLGGYLLPVPDTKKIGAMGAYFGANLNLSHRLSESSPWSFVGDSGFYIRGNGVSRRRLKQRRQNNEKHKF
jgi:hypothetical protein